MLFMEAQFLDVISVNIWQILISVANLFIMFLILKRFLFAPVTRAMNNRQSALDRQYEEAEEAQRAAEHNKELYEARLENAEDEAAAVVRRAMTRANTMSDEILARTGKEVAHMKQKAEQDIEQERRRARSDLRDEVSAMAVDIARKVMEREINEDDHRELIDRTIKELGDTHE